MMMYLKTILFYSLFLLWSCDGKKSAEKENKKEETEQKEAKEAKTEKTTTKLKTEKREFKGEGYTLSYEIIMEGSENLKNKVHAVLLKRLVSDNYKSIEEFEKAVKNKEYSVKSEYCENASRDFNASIRQKGQVISLLVNEYTFECGAHGLGATTVAHFHAETGKEITLKDIIGNEKAIKNQAEEQFCADRKLEKKNEAYINAGYNGFAAGFFLAENYLFGKDDIIFMYNPYEAGPYTLPPFDVTVSYSKIKPYLNKDNLLEIN